MAGSHLSIVFSCSAIEVEETPWAEPVARRIFGWLKAQDVHADRQMVLYRHTRTKEVARPASEPLAQAATES